VKNLLFVILFVSSLLSSDIKVAVAANVSSAIDDLKDEFLKSHQDTHISVIVASTGKLATQILHNAPFDIFLGANMAYPQKVYLKGYALSKPIIYAKGALIYLSSKDLNLSNPIALLQDKSIKKIAIANPKTAPYGTAAFEALTNAKVLDSIKHKFVYAESISSTLTYTLRGADIGLVAKSSIYSPKLKIKNLSYKDVDKSLYTPINQAMVLLKNAKDNQDAKEFYEFLQSDDAKKIFQKYGYITQ
jgi:molybdate transport system substrate-binding protein